MLNHFFSKAKRGFLTGLVVLGACVAAKATTCPNAINIPSLPVTNQSLVCGAGNDLSAATVPAVCGAATNNYKGGNEALYTYTAVVTGNHTISIAGQTWTSIFVYAGCPTAGGTCVGSIGTSGTAKSLTVAFTAGIQYFIWFDTWPSPASPCAGTFSIAGAAPPPANDDPCGATLVSVGATCNFTPYTWAGATGSAGIPAPGCASYSTGDVWFRAVVPATGKLVFDTNTGTITDAGMAIYSATGVCPALTLTLIECDDDDSPNGNMSFISRTGLTPGSTVYIRLWDYADATSGSLSLCVYDDTPPCAAPTAVSATNVTATGANINFTCGGCVGSFVVEYGPVGFTPGAGATAGVNGTVVNGAASPIAVAGLSPLTAYQVYVRQNCGGGVFSANSSVASLTTPCAGTSCNYTFRMTDSFGDGWNGNTMAVRVNGVTVATIGSTFTTGSGPVDVAVSICAGATLELFWNTGGSFATEVGVQIINPFGVSLFAYAPGVDARNTVLYTTTGNCTPPTCSQPQNVVRGTTTGTSVAFSWAAPLYGTPTFYYWELRNGANVVLQNGVTPSTSVTIPGLTPVTNYNFFIRTDCGGGDLSTFFGPITFLTPIANDDCAGAVAVTCGNSYNSTTLTASGATNEGRTDLCGAAATCTTAQSANGVWFTYIGTGDLVTVNTCNATGFDSRLTVYTGTCGTLSCIGGNDDMGALCVNSGLRSQVTFQSVLGTTYYFLVHGFGTATGNFVLNVSCAVSPCVTPPANDACAGATSLPVYMPGFGTATSGSNACAQAPACADAPSCDLFGIIKDVWYTFNSGGNSTVTLVSTLGTAASLKFTLYTGVCGTLTEVVAGCNNPALASVVLTVTPNTTYFVRLWNDASGGTFSIKIEGNCGLAPGVRFVNDNAAGMNNGMTWDNAYSSLTAAITAATAGDEIWVKQGTYKPTTGVSRTVAFNLKANVSLYGGFSDNGCPLWAARNVPSFPSVLSGDIGAVGVPTDNSYRVLVANNVGSNVVVDGFTVRDAYSNANGGGVYVLGNGLGNISSPAFLNTTFTANFTSLKGGGVGVLSTANGTANPSFTDCAFSANTATSGGGAIGTISQTGGSITTDVDNCTFTGNNTPNRGGAVENWVNAGGNTVMAVSECTFATNAAALNGGAMYNYARSASSLTVSVFGSTFTGNTAVNGGGMYNHAQGGTVATTMDSTTFANNSATTNGAGLCEYTELVGGLGTHNLTRLWFNANTAGSGAFANIAAKSGSATAEMSNSRFSANTASNSGGAVQILTSNAGAFAATSFTNVIFYDNTATKGGGAIFQSAANSGVISTVTVNSTFHSNTALTGGSVQNTATGTSAFFDAYNSIFWGNPATGASGRTFQTGGTASTFVDYCLLDSICAANNAGIGSFSCGGNEISADPMFVNAGTGDLHLMMGSPAIDAGTAAGAPAIDYAYNARPLGAAHDIGAYEFGGANPRLPNPAQASVSDETAISLFPNPALDRTSLRFDNGAVESAFVQVFDLQGRLVMSQGLANTSFVELSFTDQPDGIYFVRVTVGGKVTTKKLVLQ